LDYLVEDGTLRIFAWTQLMLDAVDEADAKAERLEKLAGFQLHMILHALKCEPGGAVVIASAYASLWRETDRLLDLLNPPGRGRAGGHESACCANGKNAWMVACSPK